MQAEKEAGNENEKMDNEARFAFALTAMLFMGTFSMSILAYGQNSMFNEQTVQRPFISSSPQYLAEYPDGEKEELDFA